MLIPEHGGMVKAGLLTFPNLFCLPGMHQWLYTNRYIKGDYSSRYCSGLSPDSLSSLPFGKITYAAAKVQLFLISFRYLKDIF